MLTSATALAQVPTAPAFAQIQATPAQVRTAPLAAPVRTAPLAAPVRTAPLTASVHPASATGQASSSAAALRATSAAAEAQVSAAARVHGAAVAAQAQPAFMPVPIALPNPPPIANVTGNTLRSALLAIARAQQIDPQAAQIASFQYVQAVQQYRSGNIAAANISALAALTTAGQAQVQRVAAAPLPEPLLTPVPPQLPGLAGGLYGGDAPAIDADSFLAIARGTIDDCAARRDHALSTAKQHYAQAVQDFAAGNWEATRTDAKAAIDACKKAQP